MHSFPVMIDQRETELTVENKSLIVRQPNIEKQSIPFNLISELIIHGKAKVSSDTWRHLAENHIPAIILPGRGKGQPAYLGAGLTSSTHLRMSQYQAYNDMSNREFYAHNLIYQKFISQQQTLNALLLPTLQEHYPKDPIPLFQLLGVEGILAKTYFSRIQTYLDPQWQFHGRNRQPPKDPFNALLSLSYTLLTGIMQQAIERAGLDVWLGIYHQPYPGRPSLAVDLIEPLRPQIDLWVINLIESHFNSEDFDQTDRDGCRLSKEARKVYYHEWANLTANFDDNKTMHQICFAEVNNFLVFIRLIPGAIEESELFIEQAPF
mgnify:CR=1 FL=1